MSNPKYRPASYLRTAWQFGKNSAPRWRIPPGGDLDLLPGAAIQHAHALCINNEIRQQHGNAKRYATSSSLSYDLITGVLRGDDIMRVEHIGIFTRDLGSAAIPPPVVLDTTVRKARKSALAPPKPTPSGTVQGPEPEAARLSERQIDVILESAAMLARYAGLARGWPRSPDLRLNVEAPLTYSTEGFVSGSPTDTGLRLTFYASQNWGAPLIVDDHLVLRTLRQVSKKKSLVLALRLLPIEPHDTDPEFEFAASRATLTVHDDGQTLAWEQPEPLIDAERWLVATGRGVTKL